MLVKNTVKKKIAVGALALAAGIGGSLMTASTAQAVGGDGKVISKLPLTVRYGPNTVTKAVGSVKPGTTLWLSCKVRGNSVDGNNIWYLLPTGLHEWVSARYVDNVGRAPDWCGTGERFVGRTTTTLTQRTGPTTAASRAGTLAKGAGVDIICKLPGQSVSGNSLWYFQTNGRWVSARYVTNVGRAPVYCTE